MTLFSYEIFDAVARQGSFNKAAQQLHLTPSAISHAIAVMEAELGFTLFNRGKNGVTMTSYGASLYQSIRAVLNSDEALQQSIARLNGLEKGKVKLGAFNSGLRRPAAPDPQELHGKLPPDRSRGLSGYLRRREGVAAHRSGGPGFPVRHLPRRVQPDRAVP